MYVLVNLLFWIYVSHLFFFFFFFFFCVCVGGEKGGEGGGGSGRRGKETVILAFCLYCFDCGAITFSATFLPLVR